MTLNITEALRLCSSKSWGLSKFCPRELLFRIYWRIILLQRFIQFDGYPISHVLCAWSFQMSKSSLTSKFNFSEVFLQSIKIQGIALKKLTHLALHSHGSPSIRTCSRCLSKYKWFLKYWTWFLLYVNTTYCFSIL